MAPSAQALTHNPQPLHFSESMEIIFRLITGYSLRFYSFIINITVNEVKRNEIKIKIEI